MRKFLLISLLLCPYLAFADNDIEVVGQFVVAPISSPTCEASATTMPICGLDESSPLYSCLTYMFTDVEDSANGIKEVTTKPSEEKQVSAIYSLNGQRRDKLTLGINVVVYSDGTTVKIAK